MSPHEVVMVARTGDVIPWSSGASKVIGTTGVGASPPHAVGCATNPAWSAGGNGGSVISGSVFSVVDVSGASVVVEVFGSDSESCDADDASFSDPPQAVTIKARASPLIAIRVR